MKTLCLGWMRRALLNAALVALGTVVVSAQEPAQSPAQTPPQSAAQTPAQTQAPPPTPAAAATPTTAQTPTPAPDATATPAQTATPAPAPTHAPAQAPAAGSAPTPAAQAPAPAPAPAAAPVPAAPATAPVAQEQTTAKVDLTVVAPESVGFDSARLERLHALIQEEIDKKEIAGAVTLLARHGKVVDYRAYGLRDMATNDPMTLDTIFRDYSMTKPVTGVAMMILYEQGKWMPSDPVAKHIPEFAHLKVFTGVDADGKMVLVDPDHAPTMHELMSHSAGFSYGNGNTFADAMYHNLGVRQASSLQDMIDRLAKIPLLYQPGKAWVYSLSMDIEGYIVEKLSGQTLPDFMRDQIFTPLGMRDAGFYVPEEKQKRLATLYQTGALGDLIPDTTNGGGEGDFLKPPTTPSGGGGLVSTAEDYYRLALMLADGGELNGTRILAPSTVKLMTTNHLPAELLTGEFRGGMHVMRPGFGYGFNCAVAFDPGAANLSDGKGTFLWDGAAGTWFWVDPTNDIVFVGMIQRMTSADNHVLEYRAHQVVDQALVDASK